MQVPDVLNLNIQDKFLILSSINTTKIPSMPDEMNYILKRNYRNRHLSNFFIFQAVFTAHLVAPRGPPVSCSTPAEKCRSTRTNRHFCKGLYGTINDAFGNPSQEHVVKHCNTITSYPAPPSTRYTVFPQSF